MKPVVGMVLMAVAALLLTGCERESKLLILATTTSTDNSGLLDELVPLFQDGTGYEVKVVAVGSGAALRMGERGDADVLLVHSPAAEEKFMAGGHGRGRRRVMHNDFVLVGPGSDPAGVAGLTDAATALEAIGASGSLFLSRGDDSGTHARERLLWDAVGGPPADQDWYQETGQGMGATLTVASQKAGYALTDRATFLALADTLELVILVQGGARLLNIYHVIEVVAGDGIRLNEKGAAAFSDFILQEDTQRRIAAFGREQFGQPLFFPDACPDC
jgi:tungstate transport system substrate-binding protein